METMPSLAPRHANVLRPQSDAVRKGQQTTELPGTKYAFFTNAIVLLSEIDGQGMTRQEAMQIAYQSQFIKKKSK
jgi:hypothetical protein